MKHNPCYGIADEKDVKCLNCRAIYNCWKLMFKSGDKITEQELKEARQRQKILKSLKYVNAGLINYPDLMRKSKDNPSNEL